MSYLRQQRKSMPSQELDLYLAQNYVADPPPIFANRLNCKISSFVKKDERKNKMCTFREIDDIAMKLENEHKIRLQKYK